MQNSILSTIPEQKYKIVIVGESGVGKTTLFKSFIGELEQSTSISDITQITTIDFRIKIQMVDQQLVKYYVWDTAGQEKYRALVSAYFKGCQAVFIVFDLTNSNSRDQAINIWLKLSRDKTSNALIYLVGNKSDLERIMDSQQNQQIALQYNLKYAETSATEGIGVDELFQRAGHDIQQVIQIGQQQMQKKQLDNPDYIIQAEQVIARNSSIRLKSDSRVPQNQKKKKACIC